MGLIKVRDLAWARMRAPDLDAMEEFLAHFGLTRAARTPTALFMRGTDPVHHIHVTEKADDAGFVGFAYHATSEADLARVAAAPGASAVEALDEPGGGKDNRGERGANVRRKAPARSGRCELLGGEAVQRAAEAHLRPRATRWVLQQQIVLRRSQLSGVVVLLLLLQRAGCRRRQGGAWVYDVRHRRGRGGDASPCGSCGASQLGRRRRGG